MEQLDTHVHDPWARITGASSGIGEEFARQAAANGINVALLAGREERLKAVAAGLTARYDVQARVVVTDLGRGSSRRAALHGKRQRHQGLPAQPRRGPPRRAEGIKGSVVEAIRARLAASQPAH